jgi:alpha-tubulin suppressor-like RCC1 family protein
MAWGYNGEGELGNGTNTSSNVPVAVSGLAGIKAISTGGDNSLALLPDAKVMAWGDDLEGQLGNGTNTSSNLPVAVKGLAGVQAVSAGFEHGLARK